MSSSSNPKKEKVQRLKQALAAKQDKPAQDEEIDPRFADQFTGPKFKKRSGKPKTTSATDFDENKIDDRFTHMFTDKKFTSQPETDKYGRKTDASAPTDLDKFYGTQNARKESDSIDEEKPKTKPSKKRSKKAQPEDGEDGAFHWSAQSSDESQNEDLDERTLKQLLGEADSDANSELEGQLWEDQAEVPVFDDQTTKLALQNYDWSIIGADEIFVLMNSFLPTTGFIKSVKVYPSAFGKEMMAKEELEGPKCIWDAIKKAEEEVEPSKDKKKAHLLKKHQTEKSQKLNSWNNEKWEATNNPDTEDNNLDVNQVRKYEHLKQRYYYAVIQFDTPRTADHIYKNCDGSEFLLSGMNLDLRYIPEDLEFPYAAFKTCKTLPNKTLSQIENYISRADSHTTIDLTWEQPDNSRYQHLYNMGDEEMDKAEVNNFLASETESDSDSDGEKVLTAKEKRKLLIGKKSAKETGSSFQDFGKKGKKDDLMIVFKTGLEADDGKKNWRNRIDSDDLLVDKPKKPKFKKKSAKVDQGEALGKRDKEEIEIIAGGGDFKEDFQVDLADARFQGLFADHDLAIDPTHAEYKKEKIGVVLGEKLKRKKIH